MYIEGTLSLTRGENEMKRTSDMFFILINIWSNSWKQLTTVFVAIWCQQNNVLSPILIPITVDLLNSTHQAPFPFNRFALAELIIEFSPMHRKTLSCIKAKKGSMQSKFISLCVFLKDPQAITKHTSNLWVITLQASCIFVMFYFWFLKFKNTKCLQYLVNMLCL